MAGLIEPFTVGPASTGHPIIRAMTRKGVILTTRAATRRPASGKIIDRCLQFSGGYGYMNVRPISRRL
jgi:hypothetical protein